MTPDRRRAIRTLVHAGGAIAMLLMLGVIVYQNDAATNKLVAAGAVLILLVREVFHGAENVTARWRGSISLTGIEFEATEGTSPGSMLLKTKENSGAD